MKHVIAFGHGVGFFSMWTQVLSVLDEYPDKDVITFFNSGSLYWDPNGWNGSRNVWEYYFEPTSSTNIESLLKGNYLKHHVHEWDAYHNVWRYNNPNDNNYDTTLPEFESMNLHAMSKLLDPNEVFITQLHANSKTGWGGGGFLESDRHHLKSVINKHIKVRSIIMNKVTPFVNKYMVGNNVIGIHYRGTDKHIELKHIGEYDGKGEIPVEDYLTTLDRINDQALVYFATDSQPAFDIAKKHLGDRLISIKGWIRSDQAMHGHGLYTRSFPYSKALHGEQAIIDWLLLSHCSYFIHGFSNLSASVLFMNPDLPHLNVYKNRI